MVKFNEEIDLEVVGKSVPRNDGIDKVTGEAMYTNDMQLPNMLYGKVLRSPYPHAKIKSIDTTKAKKYPGVKAVITSKDIPNKKFNTGATSTFTIPPNEPVFDQYIIDDKVRYYGDEVAAVAADSKEAAKKAIDLISVEYEELPTVYDPLEAMEDEAPDLHEDCKAGKNIPGHIINLKLGDVEKGFEEADHVFEHTFKLPKVKQAQLETQAALAKIDKSGDVTVWSSTQTPHPSRAILSNIFGLPYSKIRVLNPPYIGGAFGVRIGLSAKAEPIALALAMAANRPVKVIYSREEDFIASDSRHDGYVKVKTGVNSDGTFVAREVRGTLNAGAYCSWSAELSGVVGAMALSIYRCPNQKYVGHSVYTNTSPTGAMRGFGSPQAATAVETHVDYIAEKLGVDPMEIRKKNIMRPGDESVLPYECQSSGLEECLDRGASSIGWKGRNQFSNEGPVKRGIGFAVGTHVSNAWPFTVDYSNAYITLQEDGSAKLACGVPDMGTGTITTLPQIAAETTGISFEKVGMSFADTESTPYEIGSHASRTCYASGWAVKRAGEHVKEEIIAYASEKLELEKSSLDIKNDHIVKTPGGQKQISLEELCYKAHLEGKQFIGVGRIIPENAPPFFAHFADVEVDTRTGKVTVNKLVAAHDVGKAINPQIVRGQLEGSLPMGQGYALSEELNYNEKGELVQDSFDEYILPTSKDVTDIEAIIVEPNDPTGPYGVKGVGETGLIPTAAAIVNAVYDATGHRFWEIPLTEEKVYRKLHGKD